MLGLERTLPVAVVVLVLAGCSIPPSQVGGSGLSEGATGTSGSTGELEPTTASVTVAATHGGTMGGNTDDPATTMPLGDSDTTTLEPTGESSSETGAETGASANCHPLLVEVLYDPKGGENNKQWVKLFNPCTVDIDMGDYSLGWGGANYVYGTMDLEGMIAINGCFLVGGPNVHNDNGNPELDQAIDFHPDLRKSGSTADGVALFLGLARDIMVDTIPVDAVIYGGSNTNDLLDAEGNTPLPHVGDAPDKQSIRRTGDDLLWIISPVPQPNVCPPS